MSIMVPFFVEVCITAAKLVPREAHRAVVVQHWKGFPHIQEIGNSVADIYYVGKD